MDPIDDAKANMKKYAASALARKEALEAQLEKLKAKRAELAKDRAAAEASDATELLAEIDDLMVTLGARIESLEGQAALAANTVDEVLEQMKELDGARSSLERSALLAQVDALSSSDPYSTDPLDRALANVREHAATLDATVELEDALSPESARDFRRIEAQQKEDDLRKQLEAMKAQRRASKSASAEEPGSDASDPTKKPKRTL